MKKFLLVSLGTLLVAAMGLLIYWKFFITPSISTQNIQETQEVVIPERTFEEQEQEAINQSKKDASTYNEAISKQDTNICSGMTLPEKTLQCMDDIYIMQASAKNTIELCVPISNTGSKLQCFDQIYQNLAIEKGASSLCAKISNITTKDNCIKTIDASRLQAMIASGSLSTEGCNELSVTFHDECMIALQEIINKNAYEKALATGNLVFCSIISEQALKNMCSDGILLKSALSDQSISLCERIVDGEKRTYCIQHITSKNDADNFKTFIRGTDLTACLNLTDMALRNRCHDFVVLNIVKIKKDATLCKTLTNTGMTSACSQMAQ